MADFLYLLIWKYEYVIILSKIIFGAQFKLETKQLTLGMIVLVGRYTSIKIVCWIKKYWNYIQWMTMNAIIWLGCVNRSCMAMKLSFFQMFKMSANDPNVLLWKKTSKQCTLFGDRFFGINCKDESSTLKPIDNCWLYPCNGIICLSRIV